ncbi:ribose transport system ATP-binding protein/inositol transport system ATP-binding protein [Bacillus niacini]|uniref:Ribose transport system ATP-binding protein/inositol transport system ATP-binding protein n=1 Tax=Neobacillus niacini TaxID=86668 RepID=A0A852TEZ1_9BACI|nr:sugar ABC transporter ATP-binding protein [Neobacillus niacini]NYE05804.1 ribose transport system ATP-binding protein/inositol transport system ATP-binding protein [Neobacillus niacini]
MSGKLLEMKGVTKKFPGVYALKGVDFDLEAGEVHALLGENGAGKSTLMKILNGIYSIDEGKIFIKGNGVQISGVKDAQKYGISIIHQEISLVPYLSIAENIYLGREPLTKAGLIDKRTMYENAQKFLNDFDLGLSAKTMIHTLNVAQQQMIEIIKAVSFHSKIIVMDEPTSSLTEKEVDFLFKTIRNLKEQGVGMVYISHRMNELFEITDRITVMRDGTYIGTVKTKETTNEKLISMMVGRDLTNYYVRDFSPSGESVLKVSNLTKKGVIENASFELRKGEILGFSGLVGAGRSELMKCIFGLDSFEQGEIFVNGEKTTIKNPNDAIRNRIAYVTENRKEEGLFLIQSVRYNITIKIMDEFIKFFKVDSNYENNETNNYIKELSIKTPSPDQEVKNLSGGNQQKVLISRWLATKPKVLILDEPTRGVDVGAKAEIYSIMNRLVKEGVSIIMISSELPEVINMSDRVAVMCKGKIQTILNKERFSQETIMHYATGGN